MILKNTFSVVKQISALTLPLLVSYGSTQVDAEADSGTDSEPPTIEEFTARASAQKDLGTAENTVDGEWMIVGTNAPKTKFTREANSGGPIYHFEANGDANRIELTECYGDENNLEGVSQEERDKLALIKSMYEYDNEGDYGDTVTYEWSARFPEEITEEKGSIFAQWHGRPDRTLVKSPEGNMEYLSIDDFASMLDTMYFDNHTGYSKLTNEQNGWLVDGSAGGPIAAFHLKEDYMYLIARSDANRMSNNTFKTKPKPGEHLNVVIGEDGKYGTIVFEKPTSEVPINEWINFKVQIKYCKYSQEADEVLEPGYVMVWMNGELVGYHQGLVGKNDIHGPYFKFGIYKPQPNGFKVDCKDYKQTIVQDPIDTMMSKYHEWIIGSSSIDYSNTYVQTRYSSLLNKIESAENASIPSDLSTINARKDLWNNVLFPLAMSYNLQGPVSNPNPGYQSVATKNKIVAIFNALNEDGWNSNFLMDWKNLNTYPDTGIIGLGGTYGNITGSYAVSVFLCKDILISEGIYNREIATLDNATEAAGPAFEEPVLWEVGGLNTDFVAGLMLNRMAYVLSLPSGSQRNSEMLYFQRMLNKALTIADGFADFIKSDFTTNHHKGPYVSSYGAEGLRGASVMTYILSDSSYAADDTSISNLSRALLAARIYSNLYDYHEGVSGRAGDYDRFVKLVPAFAHAASIPSNYSDQLKGAFKRYWAPSHPRFMGMIDDCSPSKGYVDSMGSVEMMANMAANNSISPEATPNGHWYFNYAGMSVHRRDEWAVMWKGQGKYLWDYEGPGDKNENIYGKYGSAGALIILNNGNPPTRAASGMPKEGWDWRRIPGTTALNTSYSAMPTENDRDFPSNVYIGGIHIDDDNGMSAIEYRDRLSSLEANKSVFYFDNYVVALGSGIKSNDNELVHTTLFQTALENVSSITYLNGVALSGINTSETFSNESVSLTDASENAYYVPNASNLTLERINQTAPDESGENTYSENYASARFIHGSNPSNGSYEYYIDINGGLEGATNLEANASNLFNVLQHNNEAHIVSYTPKNVTGYALMEANTNTGQFIKQTDTPCIVMVSKINDGNSEITVMNPEVGKLPNSFRYNDINSAAEWHAKPTIQPVVLTLEGIWDIDSGTGVEIVSSSNNETQIRFNCIDGRGIKVQLNNSNLGLPTIDEDNGLKVFPIPFKSDSVIKTSNDNPILALEIFDLIGRQILQKNYDGEQTEVRLPFSKLGDTEGIYFLSITTKKFKTTIKGFK